MSLWRWGWQPADALLGWDLDDVLHGGDAVVEPYDRTGHVVEHRELTPEERAQAVREWEREMLPKTPAPALARPPRPAAVRDLAAENRRRTRELWPEIEAAAALWRNAS